ncbi:hypothetical protein P2Q66_18340 [Arthrobacter sp. Cr_A7]|nr:hypothetical protein [Arthrobacter sp. Cr_A7]
MTRHEMVRDAQGQLAIAGTTQLGGTCATSFTDASRPSGKEVIYEVSQYGTNTGNFCSVATPATSIREPQVDLTALRIPAVSSTATIQSESATSPGAPTPTMAEKSLMALKAKSASGGISTESFGTSAWTFRYQTFIADRYARPAWYDTQTFGGDNRGFGAWHDSFRTRADMTFYFDSRYSIQSMHFGKATGITKEYHCTLHSFNNCSYVKQAQESTDGIRIMDKRAYGSYRVARIEHDSAIPIRPHGAMWGVTPTPGITYTMDVLYWPNGFSVTGFHDGAPSHELWGGWVPGEYIPIMTHNRACDFGLGLGGFCRVNFNIKI